MLQGKRSHFLFVEGLQRGEFVFALAIDDEMDFLRAGNFSPIEEISAFMKPTDIHARAIAALFVRVFERESLFQQRGKQIFNRFYGESFIHFVHAPLVLLIMVW